MASLTGEQGEKAVGEWLEKSENACFVRSYFI